MACTKCNKVAELNAHGICQDCEVGRALGVREPIVPDDERVVVDVRVDGDLDIVDELTDASDEDAVFDVLTKREPPKLDKLARERLRDQLVRAAKGKLKSPSRVIEAWLSTATDDDGLQGVRFEPDADPPWADPVPGYEVLDEVHDTVAAYVYMNEHELVATTLWVALTHVYDRFGVSPILQAGSPTKRCGKTSLLVAVRAMVRVGLFTSNITPAALFRAVEAWHPTLVVDEADTFLKLSDDLRGLLNSGHTKATAFVIRAEGDNNEPRMFSTWAPKAIAAIGHLPDTIEDRSLRIRLSRKPVDVKTEDAFDPEGVAARCTPIRRRLARWTSDIEREIGTHEPRRVAGVEHRDWNNWKPLLTIAELAGGQWPEAARAAARVLSGAADVEEDLPELLVRHLRQIFGEEPALHSATIIERLCELEEGPWAHWWARDVAGGATKAAGAKLARMLKAFGVKPGQQWIDGANRWGYTRADLEPAWNQYLERPQAAADTPAEPPPGNARNARNARPQVDEGASDQDPSVPSVPSVSEEAPAASVSTRVAAGTAALNGLPVEHLEELLAGETNWMIVTRAINAEGYRRPGGRPWTSTTLYAAWKQAKGEQ